MEPNPDVQLDHAVHTLLKHGWWTGAIWLQAFRLDRSPYDAQPWFQLGYMVGNRARAVRDLRLLKLSLQCFLRATKLNPGHVEANFLLDTMRPVELPFELEPFEGTPLAIAEAAECDLDDLRAATVDMEDAAARHSVAGAVFDQDDFVLSVNTLLHVLDHEKELPNLRQALETAACWPHVPEVREAVRALPKRLDVLALAPEYEEALEAFREEEGVDVA